MQVLDICGYARPAVCGGAGRNRQLLAGHSRRADDARHDERIPERLALVQQRVCRDERGDAGVERGRRLVHHGGGRAAGEAGCGGGGFRAGADEAGISLSRTRQTFCL